MPKVIDPTTLFSSASNSVLLQISQDVIDARLLADKELADRGLNEQGHYVGADEAAKQFDLEERITGQVVSNLLGFFKDNPALCKRLRDGDFDDLIAEYDQASTELASRIFVR